MARDTSKIVRTTQLRPEHISCLNTDLEAQYGALSWRAKRRSAAFVLEPLVGRELLLAHLLTPFLSCMAVSRIVSLWLTRCLLPSSITYSLRNFPTSLYTIYRRMGGISRLYRVVDWNSSNT
jgi:hypothetical protein